eukprot:34764_1
MGACVAKQNNVNTAIAINDEQKYQKMVLADDIISAKIIVRKSDETLKGSWYGSGGWLPPAEIMNVWRSEKIKQYSDGKNIDDEKLHSVIEEMKELIFKNDKNTIIGQLAIGMIRENKQLDHTFGHIEQKQDIGVIPSIEAMLLTLNGIISEAPQFHNGELVGIPVAALFTGINATLSGEALFRLEPWNNLLAKVLNCWGTHLWTKESFPPNNKWLSSEARKKWDVKHKNGEKIFIEPENGWQSWNDWFSREIKRGNIRPTASPNNDNIIISCNDGYAFRWRSNIKLNDAFWLKNMPYSLSDIFGGNKYGLNKYAKAFEGGQIFQTFLSAFSYHCWWAPVSGDIEIATVIPGFYASKRLLPDFDGATTASLPYLLEVNSRGIVIIKTKHIGYVCAIPIGMVDVSSILYEDCVKKGNPIKKGQKLGNFAFGGSSSFAIIFEDVRKYNKQLIFYADKQLGNTGSVVFPTDSPQPSPNGGQKGIEIKVGMQIGVIIETKK